MLFNVFALTLILHIPAGDFLLLDRDNDNAIMTSSFHKFAKQQNATTAAAPGGSGATSSRAGGQATSGGSNSSTAPAASPSASQASSVATQTPENASSVEAPTSPGNTSATSTNFSQSVPTNTTAETSTSAPTTPPTGAVVFIYENVTTKNNTKADNISATYTTAPDTNTVCTRVIFQILAMFLCFVSTLYLIGLKEDNRIARAKEERRKWRLSRGLPVEGSSESSEFSAYSAQESPPRRKEGAKRETIYFELKDKNISRHTLLRSEDKAEEVEVETSTGSWIYATPSSDNSSGHKPSSITPSPKPSETVNVNQPKPSN